MQWLQCMHTCMYLRTYPCPSFVPPFHPPHPFLPSYPFLPPFSPSTPTCRPHCMLLTTTSVLGQMLPLHWSSTSQEVGSFTRSVGMKWLWLYVRSFVCMYTYIHCCLIKVCMAHSHMCMHIMYIGTWTGFEGVGIKQCVAVSTEANPGKFNSRMKNKLQYVNVSALGKGSQLLKGTILYVFGSFMWPALLLPPFSKLTSLVGRNWLWHITFTFWFSGPAFLDL